MHIKLRNAYYYSTLNIHNKLTPEERNRAHLFSKYI